MTDASYPLQNEIDSLDACILIEETCASIYYAFAEIFADAPDVFTLWTEMAMEEERHAEEFRAAIAIHRSAYKGFADENVMIKAILSQIATLSDSIRDKTPSLRDALLTALILEKSVEQYHVEAGKRILVPELARLLDIMVERSHGHIEILQLAADSIDTSD